MSNNQLHSKYENAMKKFLQFPKEFAWGAATSAYQIEGAVSRDGKGPSIWDRFAHQPGKIFQNQNGDVACDHYRLWKSDVEQMRDFGLKAYRFSIAWPRIFPSGRGAIHRAGLDFYDRLVDHLLACGIEPFVTLYHWDLPQALQDRGGWSNRDTAYYFADYCAAVGQTLGTRARSWITVNEMPCIAYEGHLFGRHAPGTRKDPGAIAQIIHHLLLAHGLATRALRQTGHKLQIGLAHNPAIFIPQTESPQDFAAARAAWSQEKVSWCGYNDWWLDPIFKGSYPQIPAEIFPQIGPDDFKIIAAPLDFLGVNIYSGSLVRAGKNGAPYEIVPYPPRYPHTAMPWPIAPQAVYYGLKILALQYKIPRFFITENGGAFDDVLENGKVADTARINFLQDYLASAHRAIAEKIPLAGYFAWSWMDNFEWACGYDKRFGLVYVDYPTQRRILKDSALWYRTTLARNGFEVSC